jgi:hypothetical protein
MWVVLLALLAFWSLIVKLIIYFYCAELRRNLRSSLLRLLHLKLTERVIKSIIDWTFVQYWQLETFLSAAYRILVRRLVRTEKFGNSGVLASFLTGLDGSWVWLGMSVLGWFLRAFFIIYRFFTYFLFRTFISNNFLTYPLLYDLIRKRVILELLIGNAISI